MNDKSLDTNNSKPNQAIKSNWKSKASRLLPFISVAILLYICTVLFQYADRNYFFRDNRIPEISTQLIYFLISTPVMVAYFIFIRVVYGEIRLVGFNYPLIAINLFTGTIACLAVFGGAFMSWVVFVSSLWVILFIWCILWLVSAFNKNKERELRERIKFCMNCGEKIAYLDMFCYKCGNRQYTPTLCHNCNQELYTGDVFCRYCGNKVSDDGKFCTSGGKSIQ